MYNESTRLQPPLYNFGNSLRRWFTVFYIFYTDIESAVLNNGFPLTAKPMSNKIRQSSEVKDVSIW